MAAPEADTLTARLGYLCWRPGLFRIYLPRSECTTPGPCQATGRPRQRYASTAVLRNDETSGLRPIFLRYRQPTRPPLRSFLTTFPALHLAAGRSQFGGRLGSSHAADMLLPTLRHWLESIGRMHLMVQTPNRRAVGIAHLGVARVATRKNLAPPSGKPSSLLDVRRAG